MPKGKVFSSTIVQQYVPIPYSVNVRLLRKQYAKRRSSVNEEELISLRKQIRNSVSKYVASVKQVNSVKGQVFLTGTEVKHELEQLLNAAQNFLEGLEASNNKRQYNWKPKLSRRLYDLNVVTRNIVYKHFDSPKNDSLYLKKALDNIVLKGFDGRAQSILKKIINIDVNLVNEMTRSGSCQFLQSMIFELIPVWEFVGQTPVKLYTQNYSKKNIDDKSFHAWVFEMLSICSVPNPSVRQIDQAIKIFRNS